MRARSLAEMLRDQYQVETRRPLEDIFEEEPVDLTTFIRDKQFLNHPRLSEIQYDLVRHIEQIYYQDLYPDMVEAFGKYWAPVRFVNELIGQYGKGAGKDMTARISSARIVYLASCLWSPQRYYGMPENDEIHILNVAPAAPQAYRAFFKPFRTLMDTSPWFKDRSHTTDFSVKFKKHLEAVSGHSDAETQEGLNILLGIADEVSAFRSKEEAERGIKASGREPSKSSEAILNMLRTSANTRFPDTYKILAISYPRFKGDAIQRLTLEGKEDNEKYGDDSRIYVSGPYATWEVNPRIKGKESFQRDYDKDPEMARAKYECQPSLSSNRFFRNEQAVYAAFADKKPPPIRFEYYYGIDEEEDYPEKGPLKEQPGWQVRFHFSDDVYPILGARYCLHGDMALNRDAAGVAMAHVKRWHSSVGDGVLGSTVHSRMPIVKLDFVDAFKADIAAKPVAREVQIRWYRKLVFALIKRGFSVVRATFDQFQSLDTMQILESRGIESKRVSMDSNDVPWQNLRDVMYEGRLEAYWDQVVVDEVLALTKLSNGKVDHPASFGKDRADALCGAVLGATEMGGDEGEQPFRADIDHVDRPDPFSTGYSGWGGSDGDTRVPDFLRGSSPW